jgi:hypothetical protein
LRISLSAVKTFYNLAVNRRCSPRGLVFHEAVLSEEAFRENVAGTDVTAIGHQSRRDTSSASARVTIA